MKNNPETKELYKKFFLKCIPLYILIAVTCIISACAFGLYAEYGRDDKNMDVDNVIYADVTSISPISQGASSHGYSDNWNVYFQYDDGNFLYKGVVVAKKEIAEKYEGGKIPIYIDGQGHCIAVSSYNWRQESGATERAFTVGIVHLILFIVFAVLSVVLFVRQKNKIAAL